MKKYLLKHKTALAVLVILTFLSSLLELWKASIMGTVLDAASGTIDVTIKHMLIMTICFLLAFGLVAIVQTRMQCVYTKLCLVDIKRTLFEKLLKKNYQSYTEYDSTDYLSNLTNDINLLERDYFQSFYVIIESSICFMISFIAILEKNVWFIVFIFATFWIPMAVNRLLENAMIKQKGLFSESAAKFTNQVNDFLGGFEVIKLYLMEKKVINGFDEKNNEMEGLRARSDSLDSFCRSVSMMASLGIWFGSLLLGVFLVMQGKMTVGEVLMVNQLQNNIINPLNRFSVYRNKMKVMNSMLQKIEEKYQVEEVTKRSDISFAHNIVFSDVSLELAGKKVLNHVNLTFEKNKKYALVGESGSGKTTILKLLMRYYENYTGEILIDGIPLREIDYNSWMQEFGVVLQDVYMFQDSLKDNILLGRKCENNEFEKAIEESSLCQVIDLLPEQENTLIAERGKNFSGGERQRISIARVMLKKKKILLLAEATSALDKQNAEYVEEKLLGAEEQTVLAVLHKMTEKQRKYFDEIIQIDNGRVV